MGKLKKSTIKHLAKQAKKQVVKAHSTAKGGKPAKKFTKKPKQAPVVAPQPKQPALEHEEDSDSEEDMDIDSFLNTDILDMANPTDMDEDESDAEEEEDEEESVHEDASSSEEEDDLKPVQLDGEETEDTMDSSNVVQVNVEFIKNLEKKAFKEKSRTALAEFMLVYESACTVQDSTEEEAKASSSRSGTEYVIGSSVVYNRVMVSILRSTHGLLDTLLPAVIEEQEVELTERPGWRKCASILRLFFKSTCALLKQVTDKNIQKFILRNLEPYMKYLVALPRSGDRLLVVLLTCWSSVGGEDNTEDDVCMLAFLRIRELALTLPFPFIEKCLKGIYLSYQRRAKFTNETSMRAHTLMGNCIVELYSIDLTSSYQHAFVYIREMALALRRAIMSKTTDALKKVLNWQFCNGLKVWTAVLCAHPKTESTAGLQALLYPLSQLLYGTIRLIPTARYFPLRFHCISMLQQLAASTASFIPTTSVLLDVLHSKEMTRRTKNVASTGKNAGKPIDFNVLLKMSKTMLDSPQAQDALIAKTISLLNAEMDIYKFNIGFPELMVPLQLSLRKFNAKCRIPRWTTMVKGVIASSEKRASWITSKRSGVDFSPKDVTKMETFLSNSVLDAKARLAISTADQQKHEEEVYQNNLKKSVIVKADVAAVVKDDTQQPDARGSESEDEFDEEDIVKDIEWSDDEEEA